jgi:hypothetical protein
MTTNPKYKVGETVYLRLGTNLENARNKYLRLFPKFLKHPLYAGYSDQIALKMKPLKILKTNYFLDLDQHYYDLQAEVDGQFYTIRKLEEFLVPPIESKVVSTTKPLYSTEYCENKLINGDHNERLEFAQVLGKTNYQPTTAAVGVRYYISLSKFDKLLQYGELSVMPLLEYLFICADTDKIPYIFYTFKQLGVTSEIPLLHLFTIPEYEHRQYVYDILGDIGTKNCIEYFEAMKRQDNKYQDRINEGLEKLRNRHNE